MHPVKAIAPLLALLSCSAAHPADTVFLNVNVLPMTSETVLEEQTVIVSNGKIAQLGPVGETPVPAGAEVIDGTDRYLMPGLAEMHAHVPASPGPELDRVLALYLANGVTTIRGMLGRPYHLELRDTLSTGGVSGPRLRDAGALWSGKGRGACNRPGHRRHLNGSNRSKGQP